VARSRSGREREAGVGRVRGGGEVGDGGKEGVMRGGGGGNRRC